MLDTEGRGKLQSEYDPPQVGESYPLTICLRIVAFINRSKLSKLSTLNCKNITAFQSAKENIFIAYLASDDHNQEPNIATIAAQNSDRFTFGLTYDPNAATLMKASIPSIVCYRSDGGSEVLLLPTTIYELEEFVEKATAALVGEMTRRNELKYMKVSTLVYNGPFNSDIDSPENHSCTSCQLLKASVRNSSKTSNPWQKSTKNTSIL